MSSSTNPDGQPGDKPDNPDSPSADQDRELPALRTLGRLSARLLSRPWAAAGVCLLILGYGALEILGPVLLGAVVGVFDRALGGPGGTGGATALEPAWRHAFWLLVVLACVWGVKVVVQYAVAVGTATLSIHLENDLRAELFRKVTHLRFAYHDENRSGRTIARSLRDMQKTRMFFREVAFGYVEILVLIVAVIAAAFWVHWTYGVLTAAVVLTAAGIITAVAGRIARMDREVSDHYDDVTTVLQENVAGARVVRAFGREREEQGKYGGRLGLFTGSWRKVERFWTTILPLAGHLYNLVVPGALIIGAVRIGAGTGDLEEVTVILMLASVIKRRLRPLTRLMIVGQDAVASAARVYEVLDEPEVIESPRVPVPLPRTGSGIRLEDVHFRHPSGGGVLHGVDLEVPSGSSMGLIGATGSGKSTLMQLLPRFYDVTAGRILVHDTDIRDVDVQALRRAVGLVFQESFLFSMTIADNIRYGRPEADDETVHRCAELAAATEFIERLPDGWNTIVGERGVSLSGGQRQRLAIARALAMDPSVLIFDDATASVDAVTEKALFDGIRSAARGRTTLVISQRVTSVRWCDRIAVLEDGRITDVGDHDTLLKVNTLYREIESHQRLAGAEVES